MVVEERTLHEKCMQSSSTRKGHEMSFSHSIDRFQVEQFNNTAGQPQAAPVKSCGGAKRGGRPVTWIGGGGIDPKKLAGMGVPMLRSLFHQVFGEPTASNNAGWLRRKLSESPDTVHGQRRSAVVRSRDSGAAIWNSPTPVVTPGAPEGGYDHSEQQVILAADRSMVPGGSFQGAPGAECSESPGGARRCLKRVAANTEQADISVCRDAGNNLHCPSSPSASGSGSATGISAGCGTGSSSPCGTTRSPKLTAIRHTRPHKPHGKNSSKHSGQSQQMEEHPGSVIRPGDLNDSHQGHKVMVYWPQDRKWWEATICTVNTCDHSLRLLYPDMTEELVTGTDYDDLLHKGHLALTAEAPPPEVGCCEQQRQLYDCQVPGALAANSMRPLPINVGLPDFNDTTWLNPKDTLLTAGVRSQSCQLPLVALDSKTSPREVTRSASFAGGVSCAGSGSGSGAASMTYEADLDDLMAKRQCYETPGNAPSGSEGVGNPAGAVAGFCAQQDQQLQQQCQVSDAANLGAWFHAQQRQQQQLQLQTQQNLQMQQQVQLQMQQQMVAHMSMQQAAGQLMHMQAPAYNAPLGFANTAVSNMVCYTSQGLCSALDAAPSCALAVPPCSLAFSQSPFATALYSSPLPAASQQLQQPFGSSPAGGCGTDNSSGALAHDIEQLKQLQQRLRLAVSSPPACPASDCWQTAVQGVCSSPVLLGPAASAPLSPSLSMPEQLGCTSMPAILQQQPQAQVKAEPGAAGFANSGNCSPVASARPEAPVGSFPFSLDTEADAATAAVTGTQALQKSASCDAAVVPDLGDLLPHTLQAAGASRGLPQPDDADDIDNLLSKPDTMFNLSNFDMQPEDDMVVDMGDIEGMDMAEGPSSSCGGSLCESLADELAVAGLEVDAAPVYYMFGSGSPRTKTSGMNTGAAVQGLRPGDLDSRVAGTVAAANVSPIGAANAADEVPLPVESIFAHMFDD